MAYQFKCLLAVLALSAPFLLNAQPSKLEQKIGASVYDMVSKSQGFYENARLLNLVKEVGHSLEEQLEGEYNFKYYLIDTEVPNAFATAGDYVFVTRGLLAIINSKDELAGILAHELSHVTSHHSTKRLAAGVLPLVLELPANIVGLLTYKEIGNIINLPIEATTKLATSAYSRSQENEADKKGVALATKAGYDPYGLITGLQQISNFIEYSSGEAMKSGWYDDHPGTDKRVRKLSKILSENGVEKQSVLPGTGLIELEGLIFGQNPKAGVVHENKFMHPAIDLYCEFPEKWEVQNSPVTVTALSPNKKATIVMGVDTSAHTPSQAAKIALEALDNSNILHQEAINVNGLDAYRATVRDRRVKYADYLSEIMWIKLPGSGLLLKVVGISRFKKPDKSIPMSFTSFRLLRETDMADVPVAKISLVEVNEGQTIGEFVKSTQQLSQQLELINLLNGTISGQKLPLARYLKVLSVKALSGYN